MTNLEHAIAILEQNQDTLVLTDGQEIIEDHERGVRPLLKWVGKRTFSGFSAADKVIGKGAAFLYVLLEVKEIHTNVLSKPALMVLERYHIPTHYEHLVEQIINHTKTGYCPIETAVMDVETPNEALPKIINKLKELKD